MIFPFFQIDEMANNFGKGLRVTGLNPMDRICIFAETKADWLVCALGCFKQTFPLVCIFFCFFIQSIFFSLIKGQQ